VPAGIAPAEPARELLAYAQTLQLDLTRARSA